MTNSRQLTVLDLCAAPGGKSTLLRSALPEDAILYSNEPIHNRANILSENVQKWGYARHIVTNNYPRDYRKSKMKFDLILCDVPCSGEGMFRKDEATIREWSPQNVEKCWQLQREIVSDAWECLNAGGLFIYSTCTFNTKENEENIRWILDTYDAEVVQIDVRPEWNITGSLLPDFHEPVYRFIPGITRGEGLFMCVLRKKGADFSDSPEKKIRVQWKKIPSAVEKFLHHECGKRPNRLSASSPFLHPSDGVSEARSTGTVSRRAARHGECHLHGTGVGTRKEYRYASQQSLPQRVENKNDAHPNGICAYS
jgi:hypothetical protein